MRRLIAILGCFVSLGVYAQVDEISMDTMRARHAVDTLVQNDLYLESGGTINYEDSTAVFNNITVIDTLHIGTGTPDAVLDVRGSDAVVTAELHNSTSTGIGAWQVINDAGRRGSFGLAGSANAIVTPHSLAIYQQGYGPTYFIVDGNNPFVWSTDVGNTHLLQYTEKMRLTPGGELQVDTIVTDSLTTRVLNYEPPHGSMSFADSTTTIDLTINVWTKLTGPLGDVYTVVDADGLTIAGDSITITTAGDYMIWMGLSFNGGPSDIYHVAVYKNGAITPFEMHRKTSNNDTGNMAMNGYLDNLAAGDDISFYIRNTGDSDDPTFISSQVSIFMLHPR